MKRLALRGALTAKLGDEQLMVIDTFGLDAIKTKPDRICPLSERPAAKPEAKRESRPEAKSQLTASEPAEQPQSAEIICGTGGCRPVKKGCRLGGTKGNTNPSVSITGEVCN
jgi:hypothetical protein